METEKTEMELEAIASFFKDEYRPCEFLDRLHDVMVSYILLAGQAGGVADIQEVARHTEFLSVVYDTVRKAFPQETK